MLVCWVASHANATALRTFALHVVRRYIVDTESIVTPFWHVVAAIVLEFDSFASICFIECAGKDMSGFHFHALAALE